MSNLDALIKDLVIANRILARGGRGRRLRARQRAAPEQSVTYFLSRSLAPELVEKDDIMEFG